MTRCEYCSLDIRLGRLSALCTGLRQRSGVRLSRSLWVGEVH